MNGEQQEDRSQQEHRPLVSGIKVTSVHLREGDERVPVEKGTLTGPATYVSLFASIAD